jgi:hypothetical protein
MESAVKKDSHAATSHAVHMTQPHIASTLFQVFQVDIKPLQEHLRTLSILHKGNLMFKPLQKGQSLHDRNKLQQQPSWVWLSSFNKLLARLCHTTNNNHPLHRAVSFDLLKTEHFPPKPRLQLQQNLRRCAPITTNKLAKTIIPGRIS